MNRKKSINFKKLTRSYLAPTSKKTLFSNLELNKIPKTTVKNLSTQYLISHFQRLRIRLTKQIFQSKKYQLKNYLKYNFKLWLSKPHLFNSFLNKKVPRYVLKTQSPQVRASRKKLPKTSKKLFLWYKIKKIKKNYKKNQLQLGFDSSSRRIYYRKRTYIFKQSRLKSNINSLFSKPDNSLVFRWDSNRTPSMKLTSIIGINTLWHNLAPCKNCHIQFFGVKVHPKSILLFLTFSNSFNSWYSFDSSILINPHRINQYLNSNSSMTFITNFFNYNRLLSHATFSLQDKQWSLPTSYSKQSPSLSVEDFFKNTKTKFKNQLYIKTPKRFFWRLFHTFFRYRPCFALKSAFRHKKIERKTFSYMISQNEFDYGRLIRVNERYKELSLSMIYCENSGKILHSSGLPTLIGLFANDNCFELSYDENLYKSSLYKLPHSLYKLVELHYNNLFNYINRSLSKSFRAKNTSLKGNTTITEQSISTITMTQKISLVPLSQTMLNDARLVDQLYNNPLLFKFFILHKDNRNNDVYSFFSKTAVLPLLQDLTRFNFSSRLSFYQNSNLWPASIFKYAVKRKILKVFTYNKFLPNVTMWYYNTLIRFMENCSGKKVYLKFNPFIANSLTFSDLARCNMWAPRLWSFQKLLGHRIFIHESLQILHAALRFKDPVFLCNWIKSMLYRLSFWKYRLLFRYIKYVMRYIFWTHFNELGFKGLKLKLKGKISVAGNARTRTLVYKIGETSHATVNNRVTSHFTTVNTFTGVLGFRMWFYF